MSPPLKKTVSTVFNSPYVVLCVAIFIFFFIRISTLSQFNLTKDERDLFVSTYSIAHTGADIYGNPYPLWLNNISPKAPFISIYYGVLAWKLLPHTLPLPFAGRIIYMLPLVLLPFLIYELITKLSRSTRVALITSLVVLVSPWFYHLAGFGFEAHLAYALFFAGLLMQVRGWYPAVLVLYSFSFFAYQGIRPVLLILPTVMEVALHRNILTHRKRWLVLIAFTALSMLLILLAQRIEPISQRLSEEIQLLNTKKLTQEVDFNRHLAGTPLRVSAFFDNKALLIGENMWKTFLLGINPSYLFGTGDYTEPYTNGVTGQFIPILFPFLLIGIISLFRSFASTLQHLWLFVLFGVGILPSVINSYSVTFSIRSFTTIMPFAYCIALGLKHSISWVKVHLHSRTKIIVLGAVCSVFFFQIGRFLYVYHLRSYPLRAGEYREDERMIAQTVIQDKSSRIEIYTMQAFSQYMTLFASRPSKTTLLDMQSALTNKGDSFTMGNVVVRECKKDSITDLAFVQGAIIEASCLTEKARLFISTAASNVKPLYSQTAIPLEFEKKVAYYYFP